MVNHYQSSNCLIPQQIGIAAPLSQRSILIMHPPIKDQHVLPQGGIDMVNVRDRQFLREFVPAGTECEPCPQVGKIAPPGRLDQLWGNGNLLECCNRKSRYAAVSPPSLSCSGKSPSYRKTTTGTTRCVSSNSDPRR